MKSVSTIQKRAKVMQGEMVIDAPVRTGFMRDNIEERDLKDGAEVESKAGYSGFVEYGTSRMRSQPFFRPSMTHNWIILQGELTRNMKK